MFCVLCSFFLTSTASVSTEAILFCRYAVALLGSIYLPYGKFDMFSLRSNSIWYKSALTQWAYRALAQQVPYRTHQRISKIRNGGFISTRTCSTAGTPQMLLFLQFWKLSWRKAIFFFKGFVKNRIIGKTAQLWHTLHRFPVTYELLGVDEAPLR